MKKGGCKQRSKKRAKKSYVGHFGLPMKTGDDKW
jgi:hypothetical protein